MIEYEPIEDSDLKEMIEFRNEHYQYLRQWKLMSLYGQQQWYKNLDRNKHLFYKITISKTPTYIPKEYVVNYYIGFTYIDYINHNCELSFITNTYIDNNSETILKSMIDYAFNSLNMHKTWVEIYSFDIQKKELLERMDFTKEAELQDTVWHDGKYYSSLRYCLIRREK
jgi:RimJ/RimL family protein N-acetyltransferase